MEPDPGRECPICADPVSEQARCPGCGFRCCRGCYSRWCIEARVPKCANCRRLHSRPVFVQNTTREFRRTEWRAVQKQRLFEREQSRFQRTLQYIHTTDRLNTQIQLLTAQINDLLAKREVFTAALQRLTFAEEAGLPAADNDEDTLGFFCAAQGCRGWVGSSGECAVCHQTHCVKCRDPKRDDHKCDPDTLKCVELLASETKPCPRCRVPIYHSDGCRDMFCTKCHTAFDWETGEATERAVHNPHYEEWVDSVINTKCHRSTEDEFEEAAERAAPIALGAGVEPALVKELVMELMGMAYGIEELRATIGAELMNRPNINARGMRRLRVQYLKSEMTEEGYRNKLLMRAHRNYRIRNRTKVYATLYQSAADFVDEFVRTGDVQQFMAQCDGAVEIANSGLASIHTKWPKSRLRRIDHFFNLEVVGDDE